MKRRTIKLSVENFWAGYSVDNFSCYFPFLLKKYQFIADAINPDFIIRSSFVTDRGRYRTIKHMQELPPLVQAPVIFFTGENVSPDFEYCNWAITFRRHVDDSRHLRIPLWVPRLYELGRTPGDLLSSNFKRSSAGSHFCNFIFSNPVSQREKLFRLISTRKRVEAPGFSMNNSKPIGSDFLDKFDFMSNYRFSIAAENVRSEGYVTEKIMEAFLSDTIPIYAGAPDVGMDFNLAAFLEIDECGGITALADKAIWTDAEDNRRMQLAKEPVYPEDRLPECAEEGRMMAFFESIFDR